MFKSLNGHGNGRTRWKREEDLSGWSPWRGTRHLEDAKLQDE